MQAPKETDNIYTKDCIGYTVKSGDISYENGRFIPQNPVSEAVVEEEFFGLKTEFNLKITKPFTVSEVEFSDGYAEFGINNYSAKDICVKIMLCLYDNDRLSSISAYEKSIESGEKSVLREKLKIPFYIKNPEAKVYVTEK